MKTWKEWLEQLNEGRFQCAAKMPDGRIMIGVAHFMIKNPDTGQSAFECPGVEMGYVDDQGNFLNRDQMHRLQNP